ncbi:MAG: DUF2853 family protein, partial [Proteobacteria bacterium]|nr:DUF2853 family protein [Pseudomonadota bacterium]
MATDWAADVKKYAPNADDGVIAAIVRYCGIALRKVDSSLVAFSDKTELDRVRNNFLKKKLGLTQADSVLDAAIAKVGQTMKADRTKNRVTVYYLLAAEFDKLGLFAPKGKVVAAAAPAAKVPAAKTVKAKAPAEKATTTKTAATKTAAAKATAKTTAKAATPAAKAAATPKAKPVAKSTKAAAAVVAGATGAAALASATGAKATKTAAKKPAAKTASTKAAPAKAAAKPVVAPAPAPVAAPAPAPVPAPVAKAAEVPAATSSIAAPAAAAVAAGGAAVAAAASAAKAATPAQPAMTDDRGKEGGLGWLWILLGLLLLTFLAWWLFGRKPSDDTAASATPTEALASGDAATTGDAGATDLASAPAEGTVTIPTGAGVTAETRDGKPVVKVYFDSGKTDVAAAFADTAGGLKAWLDGHPGSTLAVSGYNDPSGNAAKNAELSKHRAQAVAAD